MNCYILKFGKVIVNVEYYIVLIGLVKVKCFLDDEYLKDIECVSDFRYFFFKGKCCYSFRKSDFFYNMKIVLCILLGEVVSVLCLCVVGKVGFCNYVLVMMFKMCMFILFFLIIFKDLSEE